MEPLEARARARAHDAPELTDAVDVVVVGAAVVVVTDTLLLELDGSVDTAFVAELERWVEDDDPLVVDVDAADEAGLDERAAVEVVGVAELAASTV